MSEFLRLKREELVKKKIQRKKEQAAESKTAPVNVENANVMDLQRMVGNKGTQQILAQRKSDTPSSPPLFIQTKMTVGAADDAYEQEADRVAQQVVNGNGGNNDVQRQDEDELQTKRMEIQRQDEDDEGAMQMKRADIQRFDPAEDDMPNAPGEEPGAENAPGEENAPADVESPENAPAAEGGENAPAEEELNMKRMDIQRSGGMEDSFDVGGGVESSIQSKKGGGQSLDSNTKGFMESRFGHDFSNVNVHTDTESDSLNRSLNARAFTTGSDVFFRSGEYNPSSSSGKELLAHELTHVVQQGGAGQLQKKDKESD